VSFFLIDSGREWRESQRQTLNVARELGRKGYDAHLILEPGSDILRRAADEGLAAIPLRMRGRLAWLVRRRLAGLMRSRRCRVVHVHDTLSASIGLAAAASAEVRVRVLSRPAGSSPLEGRLPLASLDAVIAGTEAIKSILVQGGIAGSAVEVVPTGVDFSTFTSEPPGDLVRRELGLAAGDFLAGAVLPLEDDLGQRALLEAAAMAAAQSPKIKVVVLGEGSLRLEAAAAGMPATDNVRYLLGRRDRIPQVLASLDMFVVFSHLDGLGSRLVEAMASGLPVAATDIGTARELIVNRENGFLVPARNAKALADAILKIQVDRNLAARLAAKGRETVLEKYSEESMARRIIGVYEYRAHRKGIKLA